MVGNFLGAMWDFAQNIFAVGIGFIGSLFGSLFNGLITVLKLLFQPVLILVAVIFYFLSKLAELFLLLIMVLLSIGKLLFSFVQGLSKTLAGFVWTPAAPDHGSWTSAIGEVFIALEPFQLDTVAYIMLFIIWIMTAVAAVRILSSRGES